MTLTKRIIPCLDVIDGRVVKGINFTKLIDTGNPIEIARNYYEQGADEIVFLDIGASFRGNDLILNIIEKVAKHVFIPLTVGGGVKSLNDVKRLLNSGADKVCINTSAIYNPNLIKEISDKYGSQCIVSSIDAKSVKKNISWEVFSHGGRIPTGIDVIKWINKVVNLGAGEILITSIDKDGTCNGFDISLISTVSNLVTVPVIASGGVGNLQDLINGIKIGKADAVLAASIFHYKKYSIKQVKKFMFDNNISIRLKN